MTNQALNGKSALVTGGARRIGREIALALAQEGADVTITYRSSKDEAGKTVKDIENLGRRALAVECDVRSEASVRSALGACLAFHKRLELLVNNAAVFESGKLDEITLAQWNAVFETNARGPFLVPARRCPTCRASSGPDHQYRLSWGNPCMVRTCTLLFVEGGAAHADSDDGKGVCP